MVKNKRSKNREKHKPFSSPIGMHVMRDFICVKQCVNIQQWKEWNGMEFIDFKLISLHNTTLQSKHIYTSDSQ